MPLLKISTNLSKEKFNEELHLQLVDMVAAILKKPKQYVACHIVTDQCMSFGGTFEPCAQVLLQSIGRLGVEENKKYSLEIANFLQDKFGIPSNRSYIFFHDVIFINVIKNNFDLK